MSELRGDRTDAVKLIAVRDGHYEPLIRFPGETVLCRVPVSDIQLAGYDPADSELPQRLTLPDLELRQGDGTFELYVKRNR